MKKCKKSIQIGLGASSILMIFVVLCMMILSVLAYNHATQNEYIALRETAYEEAYTIANTQAEILYERICNASSETNFFAEIIVEEQVQKALHKKKISYQLEDNHISIQIQTIGKQSLNVILEKQGVDIIKKEWKLSSTGGTS